jgi:methionyl aminopeptidase
MQNYNRNIPIHSEESFAKMRKAGVLAARILDSLSDFIKVGISTNEINDFCHNFALENNAISAPLGYQGSGKIKFPKSICTSVNNVICHGIPSDYLLKDGDIVGVDVTPILDGFHGDSCRTFFVGDSFIDKKKNTMQKKLTKVTYEAMMLGIQTVKEGSKLSEIGIAIQNHAKKYSFSVVRDFCGHGVGEKFHTEPMVPHYFGIDVAGYTNSIILKAGMIFTIEPMINAGTYHSIVSKSDKWTAVTKDGSLSAQFEHTIGVTKNGCEIFTKSLNGSDYPKILDDFAL